MVSEIALLRRTLHELDKMEDLDQIRILTEIQYNNKTQEVRKVVLPIFEQIATLQEVNPPITVVSATRRIPIQIPILLRILQIQKEQQPLEILDLEDRHCNFS